MQEVYSDQGENQESKNKFGPGVEGETLERPQEVAKVISSERLIEQAVGPRFKPSLAAESGGKLVGSTLEEQYRIAQYYHKSGLMPQGLNTPEKILVALQLCHELGLNPVSNIGKVAVINGTPSLFGDTPLSLVYKSGLLKFIEETFVMDGEEVRGAICVVQRVGHEKVVRQFLETDAKKAQLLGKGVWAKYPKRMYQYRARAWALKDVFPDVLNGLSIAEWDFNTDGTERDVTAASKLDELNSLGEQ